MAYKRQLRLPNKSQILILSIVTSIGYVLPYALQPYLVGIYGSAFVGMIVSFVPLITIGVSIPILKQYPNKWQMGGVLAGLSCLLVVMAEGFQRLDQAPWWLLILPLAVPCSYATANTLVRDRFAEVSPVLLSVWCFVLSLVALIPMACLNEQVNHEGDLNIAIGAVVLLGVFGTGLTMALFYYLIQKRGPLYASMVTYIIPVGALIIGALDGEHISLIQIGAMCGIIAMVVLVQRHSQ
ncbi:MAG: DMT family transporter [Planctomycetes bacterium]|nr:DMT family transporter [Planctomycetota bacterium]